MTTFSSPDVMRFLGHNIPAHGQVHGNFAGEVRSDLQEREEGIRIKHRVNGNSVKAYGKALRAEGSVFRVETTINYVNDFRVYRRKEGDRKGPRSWQQLRRGVADMPGRAQVSQQCNRRYLAALASVDADQRWKNSPNLWNTPSPGRGSGCVVCIPSAVLLTASSFN